MKAVILGNAGAGKSSLARRLLARGGGAAVLALDDIAWDPGVVRKPLADSVARLHAFLEGHTSWIVEGVYGDLVAAALPRCDELHFLNPGVEACVRHCLARPWEPDKFATRAEQDAMLAALVAWVRQYPERDDEYGLRRHRALFAGFHGPFKREYTADDEYAG